LFSEHAVARSWECSKRYFFFNTFTIQESEETLIITLVVFCECLKISFDFGFQHSYQLFVVTGFGSISHNSLSRVKLVSGEFGSENFTVGLETFLFVTSPVRSNGVCKNPFFTETAAQDSCNLPHVLDGRRKLVFKCYKNLYR